MSASEGKVTSQHVMCGGGEEGVQTFAMLFLDLTDDFKSHTVFERGRGVANMFGMSASRGASWQFVHCCDFIFQNDPCELVSAVRHMGWSEVKVATQ